MQKLGNETHSFYTATNSDIGTLWWQRIQMRVTLLRKWRHLFFKLRKIQPSKIAFTAHSCEAGPGQSAVARTCAFCASSSAKTVLCLSSSWSPFLTRFLILMYLFQGARCIHVNANLLEFSKRFGLTLGWREAGKATAPTPFILICSSVLISNTLAHREGRVWRMEKIKWTE